VGGVGWGKQLAAARLAVMEVQVWHGGRLWGKSRAGARQGKAFFFAKKKPKTRIRHPVPRARLTDKSFLVLFLEKGLLALPALRPPSRIAIDTASAGLYVS
jgi:hypothetical protein